MGVIQNMAYVQFLEDGSQLHYELRSDKALVQAKSGGVCVPDWTKAANQPTIWLALQNGATPTTPDSTNQVWKYNGTVITFDDTTNLSTNADFAGVFLRTTRNWTVNDVTYTMPALKIVGNLATLSDVVDIDTIEFSGQKTLSTNPVHLGATIFAQISEMIQGGYIGVLSFLDGKANIDAEGETVTVIADFYNQTGDVVTANVKRKWYLNSVEVTSTTASTTAAYLTNGGTRMVVPEKAVTDYATVRCEWYLTEDGQDNLKYTDYVGIDDTQDPEYMWIRNATNAGGQATGNSASLKDGDYVTFQCYVGKADQPTTIDATWTKFYAKLLDAEKKVITADLSSADYGGIAAAITSGDYAGFRDITASVTTGTPTGTMGQVKIPYKLKDLAKNGLSIIFLAATGGVTA